MREGVFGHSKHLQDVASECAFHIVEVDFGKVVAHDLFRCVVDEDVDLAKFLDVLFDRLLAGLVVHEITGDQEALTALLLNEFLGPFGVLLLLWEIDDTDIGAFARK